MAKIEVKSSLVQIKGICIKTDELIDLGKNIQDKKPVLNRNLTTRYKLATELLGFSVHGVYIDNNLYLLLSYDANDDN